MMKRCPRCNEILRRRPGAKRVNPKRKFCDRTCQTRFDAALYHYQHFEENRTKKKRWFKNWYQRNKKRQKENVLRNYHENKEIWRERGYVNIHRKKFLELLPKKCHNYEKKEIKVIHHKKYNFPRRTHRKPKKEMDRYLKWYSQFLLSFCSKDCHSEYHRNINKPKSNLNK